MQKTTQVYTEFNQLLLSQYKDKPAMKAEYYLTYGKLYKGFFKEYWERITRESENIRGEVLMLENPSKIPLFNILLDLVSDNITLLEKEKNQYAEYQKDMSIELLWWLKTRLPKENLTIEEKTPKDPKPEQPKHIKIFANDGFILFDHIMNEYIKDKRGWQTDISFYYQKMRIDGYIHQSHSEFINWFSKTYSKDIDKIKALTIIGRIDHRERNYSNALDWFKQQK